MRPWNVLIKTGVLLFILLAAYIVIQNFSASNDTEEIHLPAGTANGKLDNSNKSATVTKDTVPVTQPQDIDEKVYDVNSTERKKWGIFNDGTHPIETTKGFNNAIKWAQRKGFTTFRIPAGTYLISKGSPKDDKNSSINLVSNMKILLDKKTIIKKEKNGYQGYVIFYLGVDVNNVEIKGGRLVGDRDNHVYSEEGTHEWGHAFLIKGASNVIIDGMKMEKFTGDGIEIQAETVAGGNITIVEAGSFDKNGNPISLEGKVRSNSIYLEDPAYQDYNNIYMWLPKGISDDSKFDIFYYRKDGSFINAKRKIKFYQGESVIPEGAYYFRTVFDAPSTKGVSATYMTLDIPENITIKNSEITNNRRQGISVVGVKGVTIENNNIHDIKGTAPQSGIDVEPGFFPANDIYIRNNEFKHNSNHVILTYGGKNAIVENNYFGPSPKRTAIGLSAQNFGDVVINNNTFDKVSLGAGGENLKASNNKFTNTEALIESEGMIFENNVMTDSSLSVGKSANQKISNIQIYQNSKFAEKSALNILEQPIHLKDVTIHANSSGGENAYLVTGPGSSESVYDNFKILDKANRGTSIPAGTYNNPTFNAGEIGINRNGKFVIKNGEFKSLDKLLAVDSTYGGPNLTISNSTLTLTGSIGFGAAIYVTGAKSFNLFNSTIIAKNNKKIIPLIKLGLDGSPVPTQIFSAKFVGNTILTKSGVNIDAIDTANAGTGSPPYLIERNIIYNGKLNLKSNVINLNNQLLIK
ncbi:right-handed parallel beta-helix repeat-containing protein [Neobacillus drentensis]|uniref:right-handed parallel beta-helix repeat-containing protein n=1 Tax=Neobacillus drentensis TaxID=220684 RepID=UPI00285FFC39|nr:right-handed parallel beta-helix repeat-containing protein [Neobacillus drentensis]MDR7239958.1 hypothetical protein [Neobacillus drentensis]